MKKLLLCVGNPQMGDDAVALELGRLVEENLPSWKVIFAEEMPENHIHKIRAFKPDLLVVSDASIGICGAFFVQLADELQYLPSTHNIPLNVLMRYLGEFCDKVLFLALGVEQKKVEFGLNLSCEAKKTAKEGLEKIKSINLKENS